VTKKQHPTASLKVDIGRFIDDIESLHNTLPLLMQLTGTLRKDTRKKYDDFMSENGKVIESTEKYTTYELGLEYISKSKQLRRHYDNFRNAYRLIPRHFVISLVAQYDSFLGDLIRFLFSVKPELLNASDKALPFTELVKFPDIEAAKEYIIEKEIESVIRKSHVEQFAWLEKKLNTPFNKDLPCWPTFVELTERRNLFVHTDGKVSSQYLSVCVQHNANIPSDVKVGDQVGATSGYCQKAYECIFEIGIKMAHVIWRRLCPDFLNDSDNYIIEITFALIEKGEYGLAIRILEFFTRKEIKHADDISRRIMIINLAQAYKWSDKPKKCEQILAQLDWTACEDKFKLAVATLQDEFVEACEIMKRLRHNKSFHKSFYRDWPLFRQLRNYDDFVKVFEECYREPFRVEQTTVDEKHSEQEDGRRF